MRPSDDHPPDQIDIRESAHELRFQPVCDVSFSLLDNRPVLFSEAAQQIYELNPTAAYIWCRLLEERPTREIINGLEQSGIRAKMARSFVQDALRNWLKLGLIEINWSLSDKHCRSVQIGHCRILMRAANERLLEQLTSLFDETSGSSEDSQDIYEVAEAGRLIYLLRNKRCILRCSADELVPSFKAHLTTQIIERNSPCVAFHAACMLSGGKGLLISGPPGAGKSTLAMHLMDAGLQYASDDIALFAADGSVMGVPFVPTLKSGAWPYLKELFPDLANFPIHRRGDGKDVLYFKPRQPIHKGNFPVNWIVFLERSPGIPTKLKSLSELETMKRWIDATYSPEGRLSAETFHSIKRTLTGAKSFRLSYAEAALAKDTLIGLLQ